MRFEIIGEDPGLEKLLLELESSSSQGDIITVRFEKTSFFFKNTIFHSDCFVVFDDEDKVAGTVSIGTKYFRKGEMLYKGAYIHLLRIRDDLRKKNIKEFSAVYIEAVRKFIREKFDFVYGYIKCDNKSANLFAERRHYPVLQKLKMYMLPAIRPIDSREAGTGFPVEAVKPRGFRPDNGAFLDLGGIVFSEYDPSSHIKIKVDKYPAILEPASVLFFGREPLKRFKIAGRRLSYKLVQIVECPDKAAMKRFIAYEKSICYGNGVPLLAVINRTGIPVFSPISMEMNLRLKILNPDLILTGEDFIHDVADF